MKKYLMIIGIMLVMLVAAGCGNKAPAHNDTTMADDSVMEQAAMEDTPKEEPTGVEEVDSVSEDLDLLDEADDELDLGELDNLDAELEELDW